MDTKRAVPWVMGVLFALFIAGCASYGTLRRVEQGPSENVTISILVSHWQDYDVYVGTLESALMFAFKDRDRHIALGSYWDRVEHKKALEDIVSDIADQPEMGIYWVRLWKILGPEGHLYGYMFTAWNRAVMSKVNKNTLFVDNMPPPPYLIYREGGVGGVVQEPW